MLVPPIVTTPKYLGQFDYKASESAWGVFQTSINESGTYLWDVYLMPIPFSHDRLRINVSVYGDITPCGGSGVPDLDDILAVLAAYSALPGEPHLCP